MRRLICVLLITTTMFGGMNLNVAAARKGGCESRPALAECRSLGGAQANRTHPPAPLRRVAAATYRPSGLAAYAPAPRTYRAEGGGGSTTIGRVGRLESAPSARTNRVSLPGRWAEDPTLWEARRRPFGDVLPRAAYHGGRRRREPRPGGFAIGQGLTPTSAGQGPRHRWAGPCSGFRYGEYRETVERMKALVRCVFERIYPSGVSMALYIADRESGFYSHAHNPSGCDGLFQHMLRYWPPRAERIRRFPFLFRWFTPWTGDVYDPLLNATVTAVMVRSSGWGAWS